MIPYLGGRPMAAPTVLSLYVPPMRLIAWFAGRPVCGPYGFAAKFRWYEILRCHLLALYNAILSAPKPLGFLLFSRLSVPQRVRFVQ